MTHEEVYALHTPPFLTIVFLRTVHTAVPLFIRNSDSLCILPARKGMKLLRCDIDTEFAIYGVEHIPDSDESVVRRRDLHAP